MTYKEARVYLDEMSKYGSVLGLDAIRGLLRELGNPQDNLKFIHIAGTNGKGSVLAYISTILSEAGYRTGRYVSPTVVSYRERIQADGKWIQEQEFADLVEEVQRAIARLEALGEASPTVFEAETAVAFLYFKKMQCDVVVLEAGLGGALDATNIVQNTIAAVFATISRDHMAILGDTLEEIAEDKAGIIKPGCVVVTADQRPEAEGVILQRARELGCLVYAGDSGKVLVLKENWKGQCISYENWHEIQLNLSGKYQIRNAVTALKAVEALRDRGYLLPEYVVRAGFLKTSWLGRFTCLNENPIFIVDGAHNEDAANQLRLSLEKYFKDRNILMILGVFQDKEYQKIAEILGPLAKKVYTVNLPDTGRTLPAESLKAAVKPYCADVQAMESIEAAVGEAYRAAGAEDVILACGSLSYLGKVMGLVRKRKEET